MRSSILMIVTIMMIGCGDAKGGGENTTTPNAISKSITLTTEKTEPKIVDYPEWTYVELDLDDLPFQEAFKIQHRAHGENHTFWWNGSRYTTNLLKTGMIADVKTVGHTAWVLNSNDRDDNCLSNIFDECGTCNGEGALTWYIDRDGDGLGDVNTFTRDCFYPSVDEE